jgi:hypothetical protein
MKRSGEVWVETLISEWRTEAELFARRGQVATSVLIRGMAEELEGAASRSAGEELTLGDAALESGYSPDHLGRLIREGKLPNAGRSNAPRVRRSDLPKKTVSAQSKAPHLSREQIVRSVITTKE